jgi:hypothetical protein
LRYGALSGSSQVPRRRRVVALLLSSLPDDNTHHTKEDQCLSYRARAARASVAAR